MMMIFVDAPWWYVPGPIYSFLVSLSFIYSSDDIIKTTRKATPRRKPAGNKNPDALAAKATGQNKAKRAVGAAARRGLQGNAMEVDKQVNRGNRGNRGAGGVPRGRGARVTAPSPASVRAKARALAGVRTPRGGNAGGGGGGGVVAITAPTQQAIGAAARAMKDFGFKVPKGMQMQISFVSKPTTNAPPKAPVFNAPTNGGRGGGGNNRGGGRGGGRGAGRGAGRGGIRRNMTPR